MAAHTALGYLLAVGVAGAAGERLDAGAARPRALGRLPQRRHARAQQRVRPRRRRHRLPARSAAAAAQAGLVLPRADGGGTVVAAWCCRRASARPTRCASRSRCCTRCRRFGSRPWPGADWLINMVGFGTLTPLRRLGGDRSAGGRRHLARAARLLPAVRRAVSADPALPVRGGLPPRRPDAGADARRAAKPRRGPRGRRHWRSLCSPGRGLRSGWADWRDLALGGAGSGVRRLGRRAGALAAPCRPLDARRPSAGHVPRARGLGGDRHLSVLLAWGP